MLVIFDFNQSKNNSIYSYGIINIIWYKLCGRQLEDISQLDAVEQLSEEKLVVIFKHSVSCGISNMVWHQFQNNIDFTNEHIEMLYLDLIANRDISNEITRRFQVLHQSPQILVIQNKEVVHHASHSAIRLSNIKELLPC